MAPLISVITAYSGSGDNENALLMIEELGRGNLKVNTPLTNSWYHYARSRYFYRIEDYEELRQSLAKWKIFLAQISNEQMNKLHEWYSAALCLHDKNKACVEAFMYAQQDSATAIPSRLSNHIHYIAFLVNAQLFLGDVDGARESFARYSASMLNKVRVQQTSARVLGVANLHNEILALEDNLAAAKAQRTQTIIIIVFVILSLVVLAYLFVGKRYLKKLATDKLTGLHNEQSVLTLIKKVKPPLNHKVNALAVFDVNNFTEMNTQFGYMTGDEALKSVAKCLTKVTRDQDIVGRIGADQFIVCLKNIEEQTANDLFERILDALTNVVFNDVTGSSINVRSSMSIYSSDGDFADLDEVLADIRDVVKKGVNK
ncbi:GGDEF domain-containing protein [Paraglaciecola aquimarina]|uniref:diguanylate cyclase n=1 Tax=Paraglaciecola aquimarina TaxID=1235557 RepID=A0ABU3SZQ5_9ALTE|nr:GGDEF domain-containing protein [Paraglaciecola aquimarina]MDU0355475.1 GGDEF domain-containing protein [Paraglaciecola aquimarina]